MSRVDLPGGAWAEFRDADQVTERQRRPWLEAMGAAAKTSGKDEGDLTILDILDVQDALVLVLLVSWSFGTEPSADALLDLPVKTLDALRRIAAASQQSLMPDFGPTPDPESPTAPSSV